MKALRNPDWIESGAHKSLGSVCRWDASRVLLDPYAPLVKGRAKFAERDTFERFQEQVPPPSFLCHPAAAHSWTLIILSAATFL